MNTAINNLRVRDYEGLVNIISAHRATPLRDHMRAAAVDALSNIEWREAVAIVRDMCEGTTIPSNVVGDIEKRYKALYNIKATSRGERNKQWRRLSGAERAYYERRHDLFAMVPYGLLGKWENGGASLELMEQEPQTATPYGWDRVEKVIADRLPKINARVPYENKTDSCGNEVLITDEPAIPDKVIDERIAIIVYLESRLDGIREQMQVAPPMNNAFRESA